ncbi:hypothetical protein KQI86_02190 [Clostridium sp. MSJ-11]|uniref:DUF2933 domain-containing protein n=1 Tax=Clostridium mobile TaxID=2841512 RepID=A0ABS6EDK6_9CLOT|nr:hypothetical protein [Clostridium mobile]MBU5483118.1 hypothetical protein [Clostridium mobile]
MKCHGDNKENGEARKHSSFKHMLHMILCCGLPIVIILSLPLIARFSPKAAGMLGIIAPFICPLMMIFMLPMMFGKNKKGSCCSNEDESVVKSE